MVEFLMQSDVFLWHSGNFKLSYKFTNCSHVEIDKVNFFLALNPSKFLLYIGVDFSL